MAFLPTNIVAGQAGHVAHSNQVYELANQRQGPTGSQVINMMRPPATILGVPTIPCVGDNVADDNVAMQTIFDAIKDDTAAFEIWFPSRLASGSPTTFLTSKPLRVWSGTRFKDGRIGAHPTFDWTNHPYWQDPLYKPVGNPQPGDIALVELWNNNSGRGGSSRIYFDNTVLTCIGTGGDPQPGSLGLMTHIQQPSYTFGLRIVFCDVGWMLWGQQSDHFLLEITDCRVGLYMGPNLGGFGTFGDSGTTCKFVSLYTINIERYDDCAIRMDCDGPNWIYSAHFESHPGTNRHVIDALEGVWMLTNGWATHSGDDNHIFVIGDKPVPPSPNKAQYSISSFRVAVANNNGQLMIDDKVRGFTRLVGENRWIDHFRALSQPSTQTNWDASIEYLGDEGGTVRIGGLKGATTPPGGHSGTQFTARPNNNQNDPIMQFRNSVDVTKSGVHKSGDLYLGEYSNATRSTVAGGTRKVMIWNTDDNAPNFWDGVSTWRDALGVVT